MEAKSETSEISEGNTNPQKISMNQSKYWVFTLNNYTEEEIEIIETEFERGGYKYIWGYEEGESGTPHLQGYLEHEKRFRPSQLKFDGKLKWNRFHWEKRRGTKKQAIEYCQKDGNTKTNMQIKHSLVKVTLDLLRPNQREIAIKYKEREDPIFGREVHWYWEAEGGWGKSILCKYMVDQMGAIVVSGAGKDVFCAIAEAVKEKDVPIVIFDIPRSQTGYVSYQAIEKIKDGLFFSGKYESGMVRFNSPHIVCFANAEPEYGKLSEDRWKVTQLR